MFRDKGRSPFQRRRGVPPLCSRRLASLEGVGRSHDTAHAVPNADIPADAGFKVPRKFRSLPVFHAQFCVPSCTVERSGAQVDSVDRARGFTVELVFQSRAQIPLEGLVLVESPPQARAQLFALYGIELEPVGSDAERIVPEVCVEESREDVDLVRIARFEQAPDPCVSGPIIRAEMVIEELAVAVEKGVLRLGMNDAAAGGSIPIPSVVRAVANRQTAAAIVELAVGSVRSVPEVKVKAGIGVAEFKEHGPAQLAVLLAGYVARADQTVPTVYLEVVCDVVLAVGPFTHGEEFGPEELIPFERVESFHDEVVRLKEERLGGGVHGGDVVRLIRRSDVGDDVFDASVGIDLHFARTFEGHARSEDALAAHDLLRIGTEVVLFGGADEVHVVPRLKLRAAGKRRALRDLNAGVREVGGCVFVENFKYGAFGLPNDVLEDYSIEPVHGIDRALVAVDHKSVSGGGHVLHGSLNFVANEVGLCKVCAADQNNLVVGERGVIDGALRSRYGRRDDLAFDRAGTYGHAVPGRGEVGEGTCFEFRQRAVDAARDRSVALDRDGILGEASGAFGHVRKHVSAGYGDRSVNDAGRRISDDLRITDCGVAVDHDVLSRRRRDVARSCIAEDVACQ